MVDKGEHVPRETADETSQASEEHAQRAKRAAMMGAWTRTATTREEAQSPPTGRSEQLLCGALAVSHPLSRSMWIELMIGGDTAKKKSMLSNSEGPKRLSRGS